jgi:primosomal protein N' (replication factor Y)
MGAAQEMGEWGRRMLKGRPDAKVIEILGPSPAPLVKLKGKYRYQMLLKGTQANLLHRFARELAERMKRQWAGRKINFSIDVDPISVM